MAIVIWPSSPNRPLPFRRPSAQQIARYVIQAGAVLMVVVSITVQTSSLLPAGPFHPEVLTATEQFGAVAITGSTAGTCLLAAAARWSISWGLIAAAACLNSALYLFVWLA